MNNITRSTMPFGSAMVISAFPGVGKSYIAQSSGGGGILDSDSSQFSWLRDKYGNKILGEDNKPIRDPQFLEKYIKHIKDNIDEADIIFVSSHDNVRKALNDNGIKHCIVFPDDSMRDEMLTRYKKRGNDTGFIEMMKANWNSFINGMKQDPCPNKVVLKSGQYLSDVMPEVKQKLKLYI